MIDFRNAILNTQIHVREASPLDQGRLEYTWDCNLE
jgi:hypothetical protein